MKNWPWYNYVVLGAIIFALFYFVYYKPKGKELNNIRTERLRIEEEVVKSRAKMKELEKIENELEKMTDTLQELEVVIPQKREVSDIIKRIQQLAYDSRLNITRFADQGEIFKEFYSEWLISLEMTGNYHNLAIFFDHLSHFSRLFNIENFSIKSLTRQAEEATIIVNCIAKTYIFHEETQEEKASNNPGRKRR
ncbi:MAG: type 4a pilus biogenesis protein PilO [Candidatus Aminicenantaceae bacterium]